MKSRKDILTGLNLAVQERGNLTVLFTNTVSEQIGLSATEFECLDTISNNQPVTAGQLASFTGLSTGGITGVVDRLEKAGFVKRRRDTADRRRVLLEPVHDPLVSQKVRDLYLPMSKEYDKVCQEFSAEELAIILRYEQRAIDGVHRVLGHDAAGRPKPSAHEPH